MFKRVIEYLKKKRKEHQNKEATNWYDESSEALDYDWNEESTEEDDDVYGYYGGYDS